MEIELFSLGNSSGKSWQFPRWKVVRQELNSILYFNLSWCKLVMCEKVAFSVKCRWRKQLKSPRAFLRIDPFLRRDFDPISLGASFPTSHLTSGYQSQLSLSMAHPKNLCATHNVIPTAKRRCLVQERFIERLWGISMSLNVFLVHFFSDSTDQSVCFCFHHCLIFVSYKW